MYRIVVCHEYEYIIIQTWVGFMIIITLHIVMFLFYLEQSYHTEALHKKFIRPRSSAIRFDKTAQLQSLNFKICYAYRNRNNIMLLGTY